MAATDLGNSEEETIILLNKMDQREGVFQFGTSRTHHLERLYKRVGKENVEIVEESTVSGKVVWTQVKVPIEFLSKTTLGIRKMM